MGHPVRGRPHPAVLIAIALPLLLAVALAAVAVAARLGWIGGPPAPDASPLAVVPVDAPAATDPGCTALLAALPGVGEPQRAAVRPEQQAAVLQPPDHGRDRGRGDPELVRQLAGGDRLTPRLQVVDRLQVVLGRPGHSHHDARM